jgi:hypothetical protein
MLTNKKLNQKNTKFFVLNKNSFLTLTSRLSLSIKIFFCSTPKSIVRFSPRKSLSFNVGHGFNFSLSVAVRSTVEPYINFYLLKY